MSAMDEPRFKLSMPLWDRVAPHLNWVNLVIFTLGVGSLVYLLVMGAVE